MEKLDATKTQKYLTTLKKHLKIFFLLKRQKNAVEANINTIITLVSSDKKKKDKSCRLADELDIICERQDCIKPKFFYQQ